MPLYVSALTIARVLAAVIDRGIAAQSDLIAALDGPHKTTVAAAARKLNELHYIERVTDAATVRAHIAVKSGPIRAWRATPAGRSAALAEYSVDTATCRPCGRAPRGALAERPEPVTVAAVEADIYDALIDSRPLTADELCAAVKEVRSEDHQSMPRATMVETARVRMGRRGELLAISPTHADYPADSTQPHRIAYTLARTKPATQPQEATP